MSEGPGRGWARSPWRGSREGDARPADFTPWLIDRYREGKLPVDRLVTSYPFTEIETAAQATLSRQAVKPVVTFG
jgi:aryl-alcohol dehydrogenase